MAVKLPPLPGSDPISMRRKDVREFWGDNKIETIEVGEFEKCDHKFKATPAGARCRVCHFGLMDPKLEVRDERLYRKGKLLI